MMPGKTIHKTYEEICIRDTGHSRLGFEFHAWGLEEIKIIVIYYVTGFRSNLDENEMHSITEYIYIMIMESLK